MADQDSRFLAYKYFEEIFPYDAIFSLMAAQQDPRNRRTAMVAPVQTPAWKEELGVIDPQQLRMVLTGKRSTARNAIGKGVAIHIGPFVEYPSSFMEELSTYEAVRKAKTIEKVETWCDFVIDIDLDDYDDTERGAVRFCACRGKKKSCLVCWSFIVAAHAFVTYRLVQCFDVAPEKMLYVKSGNKGAHFWIGSRRFAQMRKPLRIKAVEQLVYIPPQLDSDEDRLDFAQLVRLVLTPFLDTNLRQLHFRAVVSEIVSRKFGMIAGQIPSTATSANDLYLKLRKSVDDRWTDSVKLELLRVLVAPRYDIKVIRDPGHCIKVPFSVNSSTGRISVPVANPQDMRKPPLVQEVLDAPEILDAEIELFNTWLTAYLS